MNNSKIFISLFVFFALSLVIYLFKPFLLNICIAALLAVSMSNVNVRFMRLTKSRKMLSAGLTTIVLLFIFIAPFLYAMIELSKYATNFNLTNVTNTIDYIKNYDFNLPSAIEFLEPKIKEFISKLDISTLLTNIMSNLASLGKRSAGFFIDLFMIVIFFFFAILYGNELVNYIKEALPMKPKDTESILSEVANVMSVVFYSTLANMILQGCLFAIITIIYGYDGFLTGIIFAFCSLIPVIGGLLAWGPVSLYEFTNGNTSGAIIIAVYTVVVISFLADNFAKPLVIKFINDRLVKTPTTINEMLLFFAMIAGLTTFGFWGIILGPAIVTFFLSTIRLYVLLKERFML